MARHITSILLSLLLSSSVLNAQEEQISGKELLNRSIAFHDPSGQWQRIKMDLVLDQEMPDGSVRPSHVIIDNQKGAFELSFVKDSHLFTWKVDGRDSTESFMDYRIITDSVRVDTLQLSPDRARRWRNYYSYLYGLPMKLTDQGTNIDPLVQNTTFDGEPVLAMKVTYDRSVGSDTWYFYFNPDTYALTGYRFFHNEAENDGEYILIEGLEIQNGMRIPMHRAWYTNKENRWLGTDRFVSLKLSRN
ncbi:DUF6503 family protein [Roseivirga echinicomitans]|uniref:Uncharacterized protein n=1 Tax=Roseivirga echinicomitans TaxID=296218 RepID=A0A150XX44_9BACT|nr:DUF6503 family protein [Roseivirga echinicomitans]KYG83266.1 hypothetical protein AWN68_00175 [Roseivirga echinicomitans]